MGQFGDKGVREDGEPLPGAEREDPEYWASGEPSANEIPF